MTRGNIMKYRLLDLFGNTANGKKFNYSSAKLAKGEKKCKGTDRKTRLKT